MKIWTLMENTACQDELAAEHGLSLYIEANGKKILFDAGQSDAFAANAEKMGIDLSKVDFAVLSHGHYDHGNGLLHFLNINVSAPVYASPLAAGEYFNAKDSYIGLSPELKGNPRFMPVGKETTLGEGITLVSCNSRECTVSMDNAGLQKKVGDTLLPDDFGHEQYLEIEEKGKRVVISGCSHRGILNILHWLPCDVLIGGFHFMKKDSRSREIREAAEKMMQTKATFYTCHCTGLQQYEAMKEIMGSRLHYLSSGTVLEI